MEKKDPCEKTAVEAEIIKQNITDITDPVEPIVPGVTVDVPEKTTPKVLPTTDPLVTHPTDPEPDFERIPDDICTEDNNSTAPAND